MFLSGHNETLFHYFCCLKHRCVKLFGVRHWFSIGQLSLSLQLQPKFSIFGFNTCLLWEEMKTNLTSVDFFDICLNLRDSTYKNIIKDLTKAIRKRLSDTLCNQELSEAALPINEEALRKSGFNEKLGYTENNSNNPQKR